MTHCGARSPSGWLCVGSPGHDGEHASLDYRRMFRGSPGYPIRWGQDQVTDDAIVAALDATTTSGEADLPRYSTEECPSCGLAALVADGACTLCRSCGHRVGGCG